MGDRLNPGETDRFNRLVVRQETFERILNNYQQANEIIYMGETGAPGFVNELDLLLHTAHHLSETGDLLDQLRRQIAPREFASRLLQQLDANIRMIQLRYTTAAVYQILDPRNRFPQEEVLEPIDETLPFTKDEFDLLSRLSRQNKQRLKDRMRNGRNQAFDNSLDVMLEGLPFPEELKEPLELDQASEIARARGGFLLFGQPLRPTGIALEFALNRALEGVVLRHVFHKKEKQDQKEPYQTISTRSIVAYDLK